MKDILQQIQSLKEDFSNILETKVDTWSNAAQKRIDDNPYMGITSRGKEELERLKLIAGLPRDGKNANEVKKEAAQKAAMAARKSVEAMLKGDEAEKSKQDEIEQKNSLIATDNKGFCFDKWRANLPKKMNDNNSYNEIMTKILNLKEDFMNLIEVEGLGQSASDVPPSTNKIKKDKKTKNGKVELVSVEDELFPYDGNKREQYRQKILDTINGMIQGTATLEDLLQIVRQKKMPVKEAMGLMENIYDAIRKKHGKPEYDDLHYTGSNKSYELMDAVQRAKDNEVKGAAEREGKSEKDILIKRKETKNSEGMRKTRHRSDIVADPWSNNKMDWHKYGSNDADRIKKSIAHHNKKALGEAIELLEDLMDQIAKVHGEPRNLPNGELNKSA